MQLARPVAVARGWSWTPGCCGARPRAGARHVAERVTAGPSPGACDRARPRHACDVVVGADGAGSLVRRTFLVPTPPARLAMAAGWFAPRHARHGRPLHARAGRVPLAVPAARPRRRRHLRAAGRRAHARPDRAPGEGGRARRSPRWPTTRPGATRTPSRRPPRTRASIREIAGERWALVGDAAALADPITGEGIYYALALRGAAGGDAARGRLAAPLPGARAGGLRRATC